MKINPKAKLSRAVKLAEVSRKGEMMIDCIKIMAFMAKTNLREQKQK